MGVLNKEMTLPFSKILELALKSAVAELRISTGLQIATVKPKILAPESNISATEFKSQHRDSISTLDGVTQ